MSNGYIDIKETDSGTHIHHQKKKTNSFHFKKLVTVIILIIVLIWGSTFLIISIENFSLKLNSLKLQSIQDIGKDFTKYAHPSNKPTNFKGKKPLTKQVYDDHELSPVLKSIQWIKEPSSIYNDKGTYVIKQAEENDEEFKVIIKSIADEDYEKILIESSSFEYDGKTYKVENYKASPDLTKIILQTNVTSSWRHSSYSLYWIADVDNSEIKPIYDTKHKISTVSWSPDSQNIAFVYKNNIFLKNLSQEEIKQVTSDGSKNIFNGKPDWVYEEEVFGTDIVLWWSPNGDKFSFLKSDNTKVPEFIIPFYAQYKYEDYPEIVKLKYPKAGYPNPIVDVVTFDLKENKLIEHQLKSNKIEQENRLITEVVWIGDQLLVKTSNRASDLIEIYLIDDEKSKLIRSLEAKDSWFEITTHTLFVPKNKTLGRKYDGYIDTVVEDGFNHLAYFSPPDDPNYQLLTKGNWEVVNGIAFDYTNNQVYFTSTMKSSIERHIHSVNLLDRSNNGLPYIKDITTKEGYYSSSFSSGARFLFLSDLGPNVPTQRINDLKSNKNVKIIEDNAELKKKLRDYVIPEIKYSTVELRDEESGETFLCNTMETLPLNFDKKKKYPVLFYVYGGPGSQTITKQWSISFSSLVAAELNAIVVTVDGRGTGFNNLNYKLGSKFKFIVRDKLGKYEPLDIISTAKKWVEKSYVDPDRIGVWGWSYGGFLTLKTLETDVEDPVFNYGVAVAPVTKWKLYDSIYTERYLRTPQENPSGYQYGSINNVTNFKHVNKFFIAHGTGDDNVHMQHSLQLLDEFNVEEVENFEMMIFPDSNHGMSYHNGFKVVYDRILNFLHRAFENEFV
ncbi:unnamed protein product [Candida verbasci]|uniref:Dipeptidyl aminopeptidase B n=1 Tax=Candida verbasci TaxID=1227364 RepID=A0A9W4TR01_9ASCO|nr:unnamed protein product [Candida verbasci]